MFLLPNPVVYVKEKEGNKMTAKHSNYLRIVLKKIFACFGFVAKQDML